MDAEPRTIAQLARALQARETTSASVTDQCLEQIADKNPSLNAFITVLADEARLQAQEADREIAAGRYRGPLHGIPISLKDLINLRGTPTTAGSRVPDAHPAPSDAPAVARLRDAGAVFVGKCNLHEFAFGTTNEDSAFGPARHPVDPGRSPGGSSGGSAVSVATGMAFASIGTDTGGSIRIPAAACGVVGLKPGYGEISTSGVVPLSRTLDHVGPLCRSAEDAAILYDVLRGEQPREPAPSPRHAGHPAGHPSRVLSIAARFAGGIVVRKRVRSPAHGWSDARAGRNPARERHRADLSAHRPSGSGGVSREDPREPTRPVHAERAAAARDGRYILAEDYARAFRGRDVLKREVDAALDGCDALLLPSLAVPAPKLGAATVKVGASEEPVRNITLRLTQLFNLSGHPAITMPCGRTVERLPVGAQLVGRHGRTGELLSVARSLERYLDPGMSR